MSLSGDTGFWGAWLQFLSAPIGGILLALVLIRLAVDLVPPAKARHNPARRIAGPCPVSGEPSPPGRTDDTPVALHSGLQDLLGDDLIGFDPWDRLVDV